MLGSRTARFGRCENLLGRWRFWDARPRCLRFVVMCRNVFSGAVFRVADLLGNAEVPFGGLCVYRSHQGLACMCNAEAGNLGLSWA